MKVILILMSTVLGLACINVSLNPVTPIEEHCVQEYLVEMKHYILPDIPNEISEQVELEDR